MMSSSFYTLRCRREISGKRETFSVASALLCAGFEETVIKILGCDSFQRVRAFPTLAGDINEKVINFKRSKLSRSTVGLRPRCRVELNREGERSRGGRQVTDRKSDDELFYLFLFSFTRRPHSFIRPDHPCNTLAQAEVGAEFSLGPHGTSLILSSRQLEILCLGRFSKLSVGDS